MDTIKDVALALSIDGKCTTLQNYILITSLDSTQIECFAEASLEDWAYALQMVYDGFAKHASYLSDQDIFEVCSAIGIDFDTVKEIVDDWRNNG